MTPAVPNNGVEERRPASRVEAVALLTGLFAACLYGLLVLSVQNYIFVFPIIGALAGLAIAWVGGTRVCFPLYFLTTFGTVLAFPFLPVSLNRLLAVLLFAAWILEMLRKRPSFHPSACMFFFLLFQVYILTAAAFLMPPGRGFVYPVEVVFYQFLAVIPALHYHSKRSQYVLLCGFVAITMVMVGLPGMLEIATRRNLTLSGFSGPLTRVDGLSVNAIVFAFAALYAIPLAFTLFISSKSLFNRAWLLASVFILIAMALATLNRQTPVTLAVMGFVYILLVRWPYRKYLGMMMIIGAMVTTPFVAGKLVDRLSVATNPLKDASLAVRTDKLVVAHKMFMENPWFGIGHDYYKFLWREDFPKGGMIILPYLWEQKQYIDLGIVQVLTEYGIVGMVLFLLMMLAALFHLIKYYRVSLHIKDPWWTNLMAALAALYAQLCVTMLVMDSLVTTRTFILFGFLFAASYSIRREYLSEHPPVLDNSEKAT